MLQSRNYFNLKLLKESIAVRQIEISGGTKLLLSQDNLLINESMLCDQTLEELELNENDFISGEEFEEVWKV